MVFPVIMYRCENWTIKKIEVMNNWCLWTVVLEKTLESPLDHKESKPVNPKGNQLWIFIGRIDADSKAPIFWPPGVKSWLTGKDPDAGKDWGQEEKGDDRGWDGWMASLTQWTWVWASSGSWWWTGRPGVLQSTGFQRVGHDRMIEQQKGTKRFQLELPSGQPLAWHVTGLHLPSDSFLNWPSWAAFSRLCSVSSTRRVSLFAQRHTHLPPSCICAGAALAFKFSYKCVFFSEW